jgi:hypothetical protein
MGFITSSLLRRLSVARLVLKRYTFGFREAVQTLGYTAKDVVLSGSADVNEATWNFNLDLAAGEYVEMKWSSDDIDASLNAEAAASPHPGMPSAVVTINFISALPEVRPTPP